ncbi:DUF982 domain-containing protein [Rhizobium sp. C1]|uniref:DUF982 domain-containing protein n=1 Tax=Rhizobium sp. C1 TaxID=1349799 RepID=UPI001E3D2492|nr:DUF982 domain-containing protein [Rhizobium sp. C1]MCD2178142.1 DUF982 domain-containing protein [Rhizobium sp. C1]
MLTFDLKWIAPIRVGVLDDDATVVEGPMQALSLLHDDWPAPGGKHHQTAIQECKLACHELGRSEKAREAFMAAALEAGILIFGRAPARKQRSSVLPRASERRKGFALPV